METSIDKKRNKGLFTFNIRVTTRLNFFPGPKRKPFKIYKNFRMSNMPNKTTLLQENT